MIRRIDLSEGHSWIERWNNIMPEMNMNSDTFKEIWNLHPLEKQKVKIFGKIYDSPRWFQSYGKSYTFSGIKHEAIPIPDHAFIQLLKVFYETNTGYSGNEILINWYENGDHYIGKHSDDEKELVTGSPIYSWTFYGAISDNSEIKEVQYKRKFVISSKKDKSFKLEIPLEDNELIVMAGEMQKYYKHEVPKTKKVIYPRINITIRCFK